MKRKISFFMALLMFFGSFSGMTHLGLAEKEAETILVEAFSVDYEETQNKLKLEIKTKEQTEAKKLAVYFKEPITGKDLLVKLTANTDKKTFTCEEKLEKVYKGKYKANKIVAFDKDDKEDESYKVEIDKSLLEKKFEVKDSGLEPFELEKLSIDKTKLKLGDQAIYTLELKDEVEAEEVSLVYSKPISEQTLSISLKKVEAKKYSGSLKVDDYMENGDYKFYYLGVKDSMGEIYIMDSQADKIEEFSIEGTNKADSKSPLIKKVNLDRERYGLGNNLRITVELEEKDSVEKISMVYKLDGKEELYSISLTQLSDRVYTGKKVISKDTKLGKYEFDFVSGKDEAGNPIKIKEGTGLPSFEVLENWSSGQTIESIKTDRDIYEIREPINVEAKVSNPGALTRLFVEYRSDDLEEIKTAELYKVNKDTFKCVIDSFKDEKPNKYYIWFGMKMAGLYI